MQWKWWLFLIYPMFLWKKKKKKTFAGKWIYFFLWFINRSLAEIDEWFSSTIAQEHLLGYGICFVPHKWWYLIMIPQSQENVWMGIQILIKKYTNMKK